MNFRSKSSGFTLVELSIVLVIIGLLIGGILVGQSMIASATINAQVSQLQQFQVLVDQFKDRYKSLPGDTTLLSPSGNGDGYIKSQAGNDDRWTGEFRYSFIQLSEVMGGIDNEVFSRSYTLSPAVEHTPTSKLSDETAIFMGTNHDSHGGNWDLERNWTGFWLSSFDLLRVSLAANAENGVSATEALAIDNKMDDGLARDGDIFAIRTGQLGVPPTTSASGGTGCVISTSLDQYNIDSSEEKPCGLFIRFSDD